MLFLLLSLTCPQPFVTCFTTCCSARSLASALAHAAVVSRAETVNVVAAIVPVAASDMPTNPSLCLSPLAAVWGAEQVLLLMLLKVLVL